ncbi:hypothetical protein TTHERM_00594400 (macronuclear) [Tetrahymena thermophila SB210]|uniref:Uncharacterized protein n=1 Tax=Tetrahymena thermophila (strain SB210) TaxID=312017 RepID=Q232F7_TETTS|nr:hypothetical protein TTHERM_00594400 [Tetrahymena thermophila SB210]EAR91455.2 hypothetical protein TTHERM_00594400 [Tetrahymena thermophila SB210]|eukprot:XP_001011700.2 hypothetical protein TTHERM_00594400 [Tetrahymena thermophila SB210]
MYRSTVISICRIIFLIQNTVVKKESSFTFFYDVKIASDCVNQEQLFSQLSQNFDDIFKMTTQMSKKQEEKSVIQGYKFFICYSITYMKNLNQYPSNTENQKT